MKRAIDLMTKNNQRVEGYNKKWVGFYDDYLATATQMMALLEDIYASFDGVERSLREMG